MFLLDTLLSIRVWRRRRRGRVIYHLRKKKYVHRQLALPMLRFPSLHPSLAFSLLLSQFRERTTQKQQSQRGGGGGKHFLLRICGEKKRAAGRPRAHCGCSKETQAERTNEQTNKQTHATWLTGQGEGEREGERGTRRRLDWYSQSSCNNVVDLYCCKGWLVSVRPRFQSVC